MRKRLNARGFSFLDGSATYLPTLQRLKIRLTVHPSQNNFAGRFQETYSVGWANRHDVRGMRLLLENKVRELEDRLRHELVPVRGYLYETCNSSGEPDFMERVCAHCRCHYCEISSEG